MFSINSFVRRNSGYLLLTAGLVLLIAGFARGEAALIMKKAIVLCLECIGLG